MSRWKPTDIITRFQSHVAPPNENGCMLWTAATYGKGYGCFFAGKTSKRKSVQAHRFAWEIANGPIPDGMCVCHHCDVRTCMTPAHLFLGDYDSNNKDRHAKGRTKGEVIRQGAERHNAKLTDEKVREIRRLYSAGVKQWPIAHKFGLKQSTVWAAIHRKTWAHVE